MKYLKFGGNGEFLKKVFTGSDCFLLSVSPPNSSLNFGTSFSEGGTSFAPPFMC